MSAGVRAVRPLHEALAYGTVALVAVHLVGIALHSIRRDNVVLAMLDGKQTGTPPQASRSSHPVVAILVLALFGATAGGLVHGYDGRTRTVTVPGLGQVRLGPGLRRMEAASRAAGRRRGGRSGASAEPPEVAP